MTPQKKAGAKSDEQIRIGCAGWTIPRNLATRFPDAGQHLQRYSRILACAEINSSFHRPHMPETWERWAQSVPAEFRFSVKAPKAITHEAKLDCQREDLRQFLHAARGLGKKLGPILFQLPPKLAFDQPRAQTFLKMLRKLYAAEVVWEPRHPSWFDSEADELLKDFEIARVAADPSVVPAAAEAGGWKKLIYYRLHGSPRRYYSAYDSDYLNSLAVKLKAEPSPRKTGSAWCIFDNTASGAAVGNSLELLQLVSGTAR